MPITNPTLAAHPFLAGLVDDGYYPDVVVDKARAVLVRLCEQIEATRPTTDAEMLALTHTATEVFNDLQDEFYEHDRELETVARECIAEDFATIVGAYGFILDIEEVIAPRDW